MGIATLRMAARWVNGSRASRVMLRGEGSSSARDRSMLCPSSTISLPFAILIPHTCRHTGGHREAQRMLAPPAPRTVLQPHASPLFCSPHEPATGLMQGLMEGQHMGSTGGSTRPTSRLFLARALAVAPMRVSTMALRLGNQSQAWKTPVCTCPGGGGDFVATTPHPQIHISCGEVRTWFATGCYVTFTAHLETRWRAVP